MRIAIVNDTIGESSGSNQACARMAERFAAVGCSVAWLGSPDRTFDPTSSAMRRLSERAVRLYPLRIAPTARRFAVIAQRVARLDACERLNHALEEYDPDVAIICNVHNVLSAAAIQVVVKRARATVFFPFDNWTWCIRKYNHVPGEEGPCRACIVGVGGKAFAARCGGSSLATATSSAVNHWLWAGGGLWEIDTWVCATAFHAEVLNRKGVAREKILSDIQFPVEAGLASTVPSADGPLAYYGSTMACKGVLGLASALAECRGVSVELFLSEAPDPELAGALARVSNQNQICINTSLRWSSGLRERISRARAVIVPSTWDSVGEQVLFESQALGKAVIASDIEIHRRLVVPGETGWLAGGARGRSLSACLEEAWESPSVAQALGSEARGRLMRLDEEWPERFLKGLEARLRASREGRA